MGLKRLNKDGFQGEFYEAFARIADANIAPPHVKVVGTMEISHTGGKGIDLIKDAIVRSLGSQEDQVVKIHYLGSPRYKIEVVAEDYKEAETTLKSTVDTIVDNVTKNGGRASFTRDE